MDSERERRVAGIYAKARRAEMHIHELIRDTDQHIADNPLVLRFDPERGPASAYRMIVHDFVPPDYLAMGVRIGDAIHNLRSVLDATVWHLAIVGSGVDPPPFVNRRKPQFPIFDKAEDFERVGTEMVASVAEAPFAIVKESQPCYAPLNTRHLHPLALLARLSNNDKHRVVVPMSVIPHSIESDSRIEFDEGVRFLGIDYADVSLENDAVALTIRFDRPTKVNMDLGLTTSIVLDLVSLGYAEGFAPYGDVLNAVAEEVDAIVRVLRPYF